MTKIKRFSLESVPKRASESPRCASAHGRYNSSFGIVDLLAECNLMLCGDIGGDAGDDALVIDTTEDGARKQKQEQEDEYDREV